MGSHGETVSGTARVQYGYVTVATPAVTTALLTTVCATGGPADRPDL